MRRGLADLRLDSEAAVNSGDARRRWCSWPSSGVGEHRAASAWRSFRTSPGATMLDFVTRNITAGTTVYTDGLKSFQGANRGRLQPPPTIYSRPHAGCGRAPSPSFPLPTG